MAARASMPKSKAEMQVTPATPSFKAGIHESK